MHVCSSEESAVGFPVIPVVRGRKESANLEMLREAPAKFIERLHITIRPVYIPLAMIEVNIRHYEYAALIQKLRYFSELLELEVSDIFENALGYYDIESFAVELDGRFKEVGFNQIRRRVMYSYIYTMVFD